MIGALPATARVHGRTATTELRAAANQIAAIANDAVAHRAHVTTYQPATHRNIFIWNPYLHAIITSLTDMFSHHHLSECCSYLVALVSSVIQQYER